VPANTEWENLPPGQEDELKPQAMLASQALKLGIGAAAGACLVLALIAGVPFLRARVQATANARLGGSNPANLPAFQVEVADLNNRRWILRSDGEAGSPFSDTPSRRDRQPESSSAPRNQSAKSSRSNDSDDSNDTVNAPQPKLPRPGELALSRPHETQAQAPSAQLVAPSIFDGITPPIGSVSDRLADGGPEAPGIVQPESQPSVHTSALQAAVLLQRVAPAYPKAASEAHLTGEVRINATIGRDGIPRELKVISGDPRLVDAARAAISQWRYRPATLGGQPIDTQIVVSVGFELK
jgi:TonB family protein